VPESEYEIGEADPSDQEEKDQLTDYNHEHPEKDQGAGVKEELDPAHFDPSSGIEGRVDVDKDKGKDGDKHHLGNDGGLILQVIGNFTEYLP
jgi:hypothetical protein